MGVLPIALLILGIYTVLSLATQLLSPFSSVFGLKFDPGTWIGGIVSFSICLLLFFLLGLALRTPGGRVFFGNIEKNYFRALPFYSTIRDSLQAFVGIGQNSFSEVVLVDCFNTGTLMTGFVTDEHQSGVVTVFVPTGPNPANGCIYHVPKEKITYVDVNVETALRTIISVGVDSAQLFDLKRPSEDIIEVVVEDV